MAIYKAAESAGYTDDDAQKLGSVIETIGDSATPQQVVDAARSARSPIHHLFEWDDGEAAEKYRLHQARNHINHLRIVVRGNVGETKAFHSVVVVRDDQRNRVYASMKKVAKDPDLTQQVLQKALAELRGWKARHEEYKQAFGEVFVAIDKAAKKIEAVKKRLKKSA